MHTCILQNLEITNHVHLPKSFSWKQNTVEQPDEKDVDNASLSQMTKDIQEYKNADKSSSSEISSKDIVPNVEPPPQALLSSVAGPLGTTASKCVEMKVQHFVEPGSSWGSLTLEQQRSVDYFKRTSRSLINLV